MTVALPDFSLTFFHASFTRALTYKVQNEEEYTNTIANKTNISLMGSTAVNYSPSETTEEDPTLSLNIVLKKGKRKVQGVPQSQTAALPRHQEEEETNKSKQA